MFFKRIHTVILFTQDCIARVDLSQGKSIEVVRCMCMDRTAHHEVGEAIEAALRLQPIRWPHVYVLSDELWAGSVSLAKEVVTAVSPGQLEQTLALEIEFESGNSPFDSRVAYSRIETVDGDPTWWVTQISADQMAEIIGATNRCRGKFVAAAWISTAALVQPCSRPLILDPSSSETCADFATQWLSRYLRGDRDLAAIRSTSRQKVAARSQRTISLIGLVVIASLVGVHQAKAYQLATAKRELSRLTDQERVLRTTLDRTEQTARQAQEKKLLHDTMVREHNQRQEQLRIKQRSYEAARRRPVQVVRALAATADPDHWVQRIKLAGCEVTVSGIAVSSTAVTRLAHRMERELESAQWIVQATNLATTESSPLVRFDMTLVAVGSRTGNVAAASGVALRVR